MLYLLFAMLALVAWIVAEAANSRTWVRVLFGGAAIGVVGMGCWGICKVSSQFDKTMQTNTVAKNLANGLVEITSKPYELDPFRERLNRMNDAINPTYEDHSSAATAIAEFLSDYGIEYRDEIPITVDNMHPKYE